jgi:hypothetical protein
MWEEHPEYQKYQARMIGVLLVLLVVGFAGYAVDERDWDLLKQVFLFTAAFLVAAVLLVGFAWVLMRIITWKWANGSKNRDDRNS